MLFATVHRQEKILEKLSYKKGSRVVREAIDEAFICLRAGNRLDELIRGLLQPDPISRMPMEKAYEFFLRAT
jgi:hypothetical protein